VIFVNFKTYKEGTGQAALSLVRTIEEVSADFHLKIIPVLQASDLKEARETSKLEIWVQSIDPVNYGAHTGSVLAEAVFEDGAAGTFLNHSENKFSSFENLQEAAARAKSVGLKTLIFAADLEELEKVSGLKPTFVAYEPPELVGSETTSVSEARPEIIKKAAERASLSGLPLIVGAGIKSEKDVKVSLELGSVGIAVASNIVKAEDQRQALVELVGAFRNI
jgi:triosephosphate isomerase (TIM)